MSELPPREPSPEEELRIVNAQRVDLIARHFGGRLSESATGAYLSTFSNELMASQEKLKEAALMIDKYLFTDDLISEKLATMDWQSDVEQMHQVNLDSSDSDALSQQFENIVAGIRAMALLVGDEVQDPRTVAYEALLNGLAERFDVSEVARPDFLRFRDLSQYDLARLAKDLTDQFPAASADAVTEVAREGEAEGMDKRMARRMTETNAELLAKERIARAGTAARFLSDYPNPMDAVDLILDIRDGKVPVEVAGK